jgi:HSP20 family protein
MRSRIQAVVLPSEVGEFGDEARRLFRELGQTTSPDALTGECAPAVDVYETDEAVEVVMDLPGVEADAVRVVIKGDVVLIAGEKASRRGRGDCSFHLVERDFGRFARLVRLTAACEAGRARAALINGELRVTIPKVVDRRGRAIQVPVTTARPTN